MSDNSTNNKRIAKNTIALYFRTFITMIVGLYTGRVMLQALGVEDYGINAVVGGIVAMSALITNMMSASISRYITYSLGTGDKNQVKTIFSTAINAQIVMAFLVALALEVAGVWFLNSGANIPDNRMHAANFVLQFSIITLMISMFSVPFNATIIAHERMGVYAYVSIADAFMRLGICLIIQVYGEDRLILLSLLHVIEALLIQVFYGWYCSKNFEEARYSHKVFDKSLIKELSIFSGWSLLNSSAWTFSTQGVNMLVNVFFGVTFNASRNVAYTVNSMVQSFVNNFTTAFAPQITKTYAAGNIDYSVQLVNRGTKFTLLMLLVFVVPVCMEADTLLELWLGEVPPLSALFLRLSMFETLAISSGSNLLRIVQANGDIKFYSISTALWAGLVFPICWIAYSLGAPVWVAYIVFITIFSTQNIVRYIAIKRLMRFSIRTHFRECIAPFIMVAISSFFLPFLLSIFFNHGIVRFCIIVPVSVSWTLICSYIWGLSHSEKTFVLNKFKLIIKKYI